MSFKNCGGVDHVTVILRKSDNYFIGFESEPKFDNLSN